MRVVVTAVAGDFITDEIRFFVGFVGTLQLNLSHHETLVVAKELVDLEGVGAAVHKIAALVDDTRLTETEQLFGLLKGNLLLELIAAQAAIDGRALDGEEALLIADADTYGAPATTTNVTLSYAVALACAALVVIAAHQEFPLYLHAAHGLSIVEDRIGTEGNGHDDEDSENPVYHVAS